MTTADTPSDRAPIDLAKNLELLRAGLPWVTVKADERIPFFKSIERAQVDGDIAPFVALVSHLIHGAITEVNAASTRRRTR